MKFAACDHDDVDEGGNRDEGEQHQDPGRSVDEEEGDNAGHGEHQTGHSEH